MSEVPENSFHLGLQDRKPTLGTWAADTGGGEMGALMRTIDWSRTPIGPVETWSQTLRTIANFLLANRFPMLLWWGPEYVSIYNDAYRPILGAKHPKSMGQPVSECWAEIWHILKPLIDTPFNGGPATWMDDIPLEINRHGFTEETHFTIAYSPVPDETAPRGIGGVLATVHEITEKVVGERRLTILRDLGARAAEGKTAEEACAIAVATLGDHAKDVPFALLYLVGSEGKVARLAGAAGAEPGEPVSPHEIGLEHASVDGLWPLVEAMEREETIVVEDLASRFTVVPSGPWSDPPRSAAIVPVHSNKAHELAGLLVVGISPRLKFDELYRSFLGLMAAQIATSIANARAYEEERKRAEALAEIDRAKTTFFSNVSHEFRTPLTLMLGPISDLLSKPADQIASEDRDLASLAHRNGLRLLKLVNSLLDFSRIEAGRVGASYEPTDLAALTVELASNFRSAFEKAKLTLKIDAPPVGEPVYIDRDMWEKIVLNLLSNAFKFTLEGGVKVELRKDDERVVLSVRDTGIGIPKYELPRLFERFHRIEGAQGRTHEGSGIGLALVQELAKLHGGNVVVESAPGSGSSFRVSVPLGSAHLAQDRLGAPRAQASTALGAHPYVDEALRWLPESSDGQTEDAFEQPLLPQSDLSADAGGERATILLADDNADMRDYVRRLLGARYHVETVPDGQAALESIRNRRPDLVLSDVMMPRLDGFALVRAIRADSALVNLPIVLLSARAGEDASIEGLETGADDYLVKPFSARELVARVNANVGMARLRQEAEQSATAELEALKRLNAIGNRCVRAGDDLEACLTEILDAAVAFTSADKGNIQLLDQTSSVLGIAVHRGFAKPFLDFFTRVDRRDAAACGTAMRSAERVIIEDVTRSDIFVGQRSLDVLLEAGVRAVQSTPLVSSAGETLGMISTHFSDVHRPSERELGLLDLLARQAADYLERQRIERRVRSLSEELRRTLETADVGLARGGRDLRYASANSAYAKIIGRPLDQIVGRPIAGVLGEEVFSTLRPHIERVLRGERVEFEADRRRAGDGAGWISVVYVPYKDDDGSVIGWVASVTDITDRKVAELALRDNEERFRALVTAGSYVVYRMSPDWTEMLQLDGQDFIANTEAPSSSWLDEYIFPDDQPMVTATISEAIGSKRIFELEHRVKRVDGSVGWTLSRAVPLLNPQGEITEWFGAASDVTARKQAEERLKELNDSLEQMVEERSRALEETERRFHLLVEAVADYAIFMLDETGHVVNWNTGARRIKGYSPEEIIGQHFSRFYTEEDRRDGVPERALATAAREGRFETEGWRVRKDGSRFWASVVINEIHDADSRLLGFAKVTRDLTERRAAQEQLNQAQKMEAIGQLTGGVAHDFNNLLTVISGNIEALQRRLSEAPKADLRRLASSAHRGAERAAILTHRLLAFSRRQPLEPKSLSVNTLVSGMSEMLHRTLGESLAIEIVLAGGVWSTFVDANQLENAVLNLAINARDAMPDGGKLTIETANAHLDDDYAVQADVLPGQYVGIFVSDTGIGMTSETASKAFEPFFTTKEVGQGTGLGLSQVYGFIRQSNGHAKIYSELGAGTTVKLYLPRHLSSDTASEIQADAQPIPRGEGETILVVDDDADVRSFTVETLRELGYVILEAPDGATGLRLLDAHPEIELLFTDVGLPGGMNGRQLADEAKRRRARLKVLFASGYARNAIVHHGRLDPGVELLSKPYSFGTLAARVRRVMDER